MKPSLKIRLITPIIVISILLTLNVLSKTKASLQTTGTLTFDVSEPVIPVLSVAVRDLNYVVPEAYLAREINPLRWLGEEVHQIGQSPGLDPLISNSVNGGISPEPMVTFEGVPSLSGVTPPDTIGDVGPNHYVQMTNFYFRIWNKGDPENGTSPTPVTSPTSIGTLFTSVGNGCETNFGDPVVMYDDMADRWVLTQINASNFGMCIAVSSTPDPTGSYYLYYFSTPDYPDYPRLGIWPDAYFLGTNSGFPNQFYAHAFNREAMLSGLPATRQSFGGLPNLLLPADVDGPMAPPEDAPGIFYTFYHPDMADQFTSIQTTRVEITSQLIQNPAAQSSHESKTPAGEGDLLSDGPVPTTSDHPKIESGSTTLDTLLGSNAYSIDHVNYFYTIFDVDDPEILPFVNSFTSTAFIGAGEYYNGMVYMINSDETVWEVSPGTGNIINTYAATAPADGENYSGLAFDPVTGVVYASSTNCGISSTLYTIDLKSGLSTEIGSVTNSPCLIGIAVDGEGVLWGYDISNDNLLQIDKGTGEGNLIGPIGFNANFGQGLGWDPATDTLYMAAFNSSTSQAELRTVNRTTGNTTLVGVLGLTNPGSLTQLPWLGFNIPLPSEHLAFYEFHVDWNTPSNSTFVPAAQLPMAPFNYTICGYFSGGCLNQPGTSQLLDDLSWWPMHRLQYRNFGEYAAMVGNFTVDANNGGRAGIRWFEVRKTGDTYILFQEGTYSPDTDSRWMGSIAMDMDGNIALGYSVSGTQTKPSIRYATRLKLDLRGSLNNEAEMWAGVGVQTGIHRWGDYSSMAIDPLDGCTFWYTNEYHDGNDNGFGWNTRVGIFKIPSCGGASGKESFLPITIRPNPFFQGPNEQEDNDNAQQANGPLYLNTTYNALPNDNWDYFYVNINYAGQITVDVTNHPLASVTGAQVQLYYQSVSAGNKVGESLLPPYQINYSGQPGKYYIVVFTDISKCGPCGTQYQLKVSFP